MGVSAAYLKVPLLFDLPTLLSEIESKLVQDDAPEMCLYLLMAKVFEGQEVQN